VATALAFALGGVWYGPLFGKAWMAAHGFTEQQLREGFDPAKTYGLTAVLAALSAIVFGIFLDLLGSHAPLFAVGFGFSAGLFWVGASLATNALFERTSLRLVCINGGYHVARFTLMGAAFGWLR
jgi:hypothetical protein